ncbi:alpha/beta fold hydrolase [Marisediminicola antarctica]|uniref:Hydrolase n=1 Tax=Marisediminicola antarctica TaxID=674079 RepID=A0A7L5AIB3_9MICO|nr:alpha/beta hydrolase [Marisediminicola antarctica]QHO70057.1 hydrolase [Marisediminicola antarctica]
MSIESPFASLLAAIPVESDEVTVLGSTTRFWSYGSPDAPFTIVIAHGYRGEHHGIEPIIAQLPGIRFVSPDLPGFGESTPLTDVPHSVAGYAAWLTAFVDTLGLTGRAIILGHSFGTIVGANAVVDGLTTPAVIMVNPIATSGLRGPRKLATKVTVAYYELASKLPAKLGHRLLNSWFVVQFMSSSMTKTRERSLRRWIHNEHHTYFSRYANRDVVVEGFRASISTDVSAFAARITVPTLLVAAARDDITPVAAQFELERMMPNATLRVLADVGHLIHYEVPALAAEAITSFLDDLPQP